MSILTVALASAILANKVYYIYVEVIYKYLKFILLSYLFFLHLIIYELIQSIL